MGGSQGEDGQSLSAHAHDHTPPSPHLAWSRASGRGKRVGMARRPAPHMEKETRSVLEMQCLPKDVFEEGSYAIFLNAQSQVRANGETE